MLIINVVSVDKDGTPMSAALIVNLMLKVTCVNSGSDLTRINCGWAAEKRLFDLRNVRAFLLCPGNYTLYTFIRWLWGSIERDSS